MSIMAETLLVYGAGGHAREVDWLVESSPSQHNIKGYIDDNAIEGTAIFSKPVMTFNEAAARFPHAKVVISVADVVIRRKLVDKVATSSMTFHTVIHDTVAVHNSTRIGEGSIVCAGNLISPDVSIGKHVHVNLACTIGHDCIIDDFTTISPGVHISGNVHIGEDVFIGTGVNIIQGTPNEPLHIADGTIIGAGACVTKSTEANGLYVGVPAIRKK